MDIFLRGRDGQYNAIGLLKSNGQVIVKKGSLISQKSADRIPNKARMYRENASFDSNMILQEDIAFDSASTAGAFVTGNSTNGLRAWKDKNGNALGNSFQGKQRKSKKGE